MLKPVRGEPGAFVDTTTGRKYDISDFRDDDKYDTTGQPAGTIQPGTSLVFFRDTQNKRPIDTNFTQQSRLSAGEEMIIDRVGLHIRSATANILPTPSDIKRFVENAHSRTEVNRLLLIEGPAVKFPTGYGLSGQTQENNQGIVGIGVAATASAAKLLKTQLITSQHEVQGFLSWQDRAWLSNTPTVTNPIVPNPVDLNPVLDNPVLATEYLHGLVKAAVSK